MIVNIDIYRLLQLLLGVFEEACRTRIQCCLGKDRRDHQLHDYLTLVFSWGYIKYGVFHKNPHTHTHTHTHTEYGNLNMPFSENFVAFLQTLSPSSAQFASWLRTVRELRIRHIQHVLVLTTHFTKCVERDGSLRRKLLPLKYHKLKNPSCP